MDETETCTPVNLITRDDQLRAQALGLAVEGRRPANEAPSDTVERARAFLEFLRTA